MPQERRYAGPFLTSIVLVIAVSLPIAAMVQKSYPSLQADVGTVNLTSCGYLSAPNTTYVLQNDVVSDGTCFTMIAQHQTLDLNGHTITYDNAEPITVYNGDFEGSDGWDLSTAPNAERAVGTFVNPVTVANGSYSMRLLSSGPDQSFRSTNQVTLKPNTTYTLSARFYNRQTSVNLDLYVKFAGTSVITHQKGITSRGFSYSTYRFTTGAQPETYTIEAGMSGAGASGGSYVYIDDIRIQQNDSKGVIIGPKNWEPLTRYSGVTQYGDAKYAIVKNGTITQGRARGDEAEAVYIGQLTTDAELSNLTLSVYGADTSAIEGVNSANAHIHDNIIHDTATVTSNRDNQYGAVILLTSGTSARIYNNTITGGPQSGIMANGTSSPPVQIYNNDITLNSYYTNDFAINFYNNTNGVIHDNTIRCGDSQHSCRGILIAGGSAGVSAYNNTISVQELVRNQEYNGCEASGAYGIQIEEATNTQVYNNTVKATAGDCEAFAFRANPIHGGTPNTGTNVHDNTFTALATGTAVAASIKLSGDSAPFSDTFDGNILRFVNNAITTNSLWLRTDEGILNNIWFKSNTIMTAGTLKSPFEPFYNYYWKNDAASAVTDIHFLDNIYPNSADKARFEGASITCVASCIVGGSNHADKFSNWFLSWSLTINAKTSAGTALAGATVTIKNAQGATVSTGTTSANGTLVAVLDQFKNAAGIITSSNPFTITVTANGQTTTQVLTLTDSTTLTITVGTSGAASSAALSSVPSVASASSASTAPLSSAAATSVAVTTTSSINPTSAITGISVSASSRSVAIRSIPSRFSSASEALQPAAPVAPNGTHRTLFTDVPSSAWFASFVYTLVDDGIVSGYKNAKGEPTGLFGPGNSITYAELLKIALVASKADLTPSGMPTMNPSAKNTWAESYVGIAEKLRLGLYNTALNVHKPALRRDVFALLITLFQVEPSFNTSTRYKDLPSTDPAFVAVTTLTELGVISGDTNVDGTPKGTIRPNNTINRAEIAKMLVKLMEKASH